jgi:predicted transcriptional regulator
MAKTQRIELRVDENFTRAVADLASRTHRSKAEVIRDAMNLYIKAMDEWDKGRGIVFEPIEGEEVKKIASETARGKQKATEPCLT